MLWARTVWAITIISRHAFIVCVLMHHRIPIKERHAKFTQERETTCSLCEEEAENETHLFFECDQAIEVWKQIDTWWRPPHTSTKVICWTKGSQPEKNISYAIFSVTIYFIWDTRNYQIFKQSATPIIIIVRLIKE